MTTEIVGRSATDLKLYHQDEDSTEIMTDDSFAVDVILDHKQNGEDTLYLIKWTGYDALFNSWVSLDDIDQITITKYQDNLKLKSPADSDAVDKNALDTNTVIINDDNVIRNFETTYQVIEDISTSRTTKTLTYSVHLRPRGYS